MDLTPTGQLPPSDVVPVTPNTAPITTGNEVAAEAARIAISTVGQIENATSQDDVLDTPKVEESTETTEMPISPITEPLPITIDMSSDNKPTLEESAEAATVALESAHIVAEPSNDTMVTQEVANGEPETSAVVPEEEVSMQPAYPVDQNIISVPDLSTPNSPVDNVPVSKVVDPVTAWPPTEMSTPASTGNLGISAPAIVESVDLTPVQTSETPATDTIAANEVPAPLAPVIPLMPK